MSVTSEPARNTAKIDFMQWNIWPPTIAKPMGEIIRETLQQFPPEFSLPFTWSDGPNDGRFGPPVKDPMTIYCRLPFGANLDQNPEWSVSLRSIIHDELGLVEVDAKRDQLAAMALELRSLAELIDGALNDLA